jgi:hypothetical protein
VTVVDLFLHLLACEDSFAGIDDHNHITSVVLWPVVWPILPLQNVCYHCSGSAYYLHSKMSQVATLIPLNLLQNSLAEIHASSQQLCLRPKVCPAASWVSLDTLGARLCKIPSDAKPLPCLQNQPNLCADLGDWSFVANFVQVQFYKLLFAMQQMPSSDCCIGLLEDAVTKSAYDSGLEAYIHKQLPKAKMCNSCVMYNLEGLAGTRSPSSHTSREYARAMNAMHRDNRLHHHAFGGPKKL